MRHQVAGRKFSRNTAHRRALYRNLVTDLLNHEKLVTTEAKADEIKGISEKIITLGKKNTLASRRQALAYVINENVVDKLFKEIAPRYNQRSGGYIRMVKLSPRSGDGAAMAKLELI